MVYEELKADGAMIDAECSRIEVLALNLDMPDADDIQEDEDEDDEVPVGNAASPTTGDELSDDAGDGNDGEGDGDTITGGCQQDMELVRSTAKAHMDKYPCKCKNRDCYFVGSGELAVSMQSKTPAERITTLRGLLLALAAPPGIANEL